MSLAVVCGWGQDIEMDTGEVFLESWKNLKTWARDEEKETFEIKDGIGGRDERQKKEHEWIVSERGPDDK